MRTVHRRVLPVLVALLAPLVAIDAATAAPGASAVTAVHSFVNESTPLYHLSLEFSIDTSQVDCSTSPVLDYRIGGTPTIGVPVCLNGQPRAIVKDQRSVLGTMNGGSSTSGGIRPNGTGCDGDESPDVRGCQIEVNVRPGAGGPNFSDMRTVLQGDRPLQLWVPPRPIWIGVGDGFTSQRIQQADECYAYSARGCLNDDPAAPPGSDDYAGLRVEHNAPDASWIHRAVATLEREYTELGYQLTCDNDPGNEFSDHCWQIFPKVVANDEVSAAALVAEVLAPASDPAPTGQIAQMKRDLANHQGSWNWVGLSAGLLDAGIPQAIEQSYIAQGILTPAGQYTYDGGRGPFPWAAPSAAACPDLDVVERRVLDNRATIQAGLARVIDEAAASSPGVRVMITQYPFLTEVVGTHGHGDARRAGSLNPCAVDDAAEAGEPNPANTTPENREGILALNDAIGDLVAEKAGVGPALVYALDLQAVFGDQPTDTDLDAHESYLQLSRPIGYPYPSGLGTYLIGKAAVDKALGSGIRPPKIEGRVVRLVGTGLSAVREPASSVNGWYTQKDLFVEWIVTPGSGTVATPPLTPLTRGRSVSYSMAVTDSNGLVASVARDFSYDPDAPIVVPVLRGGDGNPVPPLPDGTEWYNRQTWPAGTTLTWEVRDADTYVDGSGAVVPYPLSNPPSGPPMLEYGVPVWGAPAPVVITPANAATAMSSGPIYDAAGNVTEVRASLNVDLNAPMVTGSLNVPAGTWSKGPVTITWSAADTGGSKLVGGTDGPVQTTQTWSTEGLNLVPGPIVLDRAGNPNAAAEVAVRIDRTAPQVGLLLNGKQAPTGTQPMPTFPITSLPTVTCDPAAVDRPPADKPALAVSGLKSCTVSGPVTVPVSGGVSYTYTATAVDNAGNSSTATTSFLSDGFVSIGNGRFTGAGSMADGTSVNPNLRCNGAPNDLAVAWSGGSFTMDWTDELWCWSDPRFHQQQPRAPFNTAFGSGRGVLANGKRGSVQWMLTDAGEPGRNDRITVTVKDETGAVIHTASGVLTSGNYQAHESQGNGTNNNGCLNGPTGSLKKGQSCNAAAPSPVRF